jgi:hypothetical protein
MDDDIELQDEGSLAILNGLGIDFNPPAAKNMKLEDLIGDLGVDLEPTALAINGDNSDLFVDIIDEAVKLLAHDGFVVERDNLRRQLIAAFPTKYGSKVSPYQHLKEGPLKLPALTSQRLILELDIAKIKVKIEKKVLKVDYGNLWFYVGLVTRREAIKRWREHYSSKKVLFGAVVAEFDSLQEALMAETTGITMLKWMRDGRLQNRIRGCWNSLDGHDSPSLYNAADKAEKVILYLLWSPNPNEKFDYAIGNLKAPLSNQVRKHSGSNVNVLINVSSQ